MNIEFLNQMKQERARLTTTRDEAAAEITKLDAAIGALEDRPKVSGPSVADMVLDCCRQFTKDHFTKPGIALIISSKNIRETAAKLFPDNTDKIKTGLYNACNKWVNKGKLKAVVGGYELQP